MKNTSRRLLATKPTRTTQELCAVNNYFIMKEITDGRSIQCSDTGCTYMPLQTVFQQKKTRNNIIDYEQHCI